MRYGTKMTNPPPKREVEFQDEEATNRFYKLFGRSTDPESVLSGLGVPDHFDFAEFWVKGDRLRLGSCCTATASYISVALDFEPNPWLPGGTRRDPIVREIFGRIGWLYCWFWQATRRTRFCHLNLVHKNKVHPDPREKGLACRIAGRASHFLNKQRFAYISAYCAGSSDPADLDGYFVWPVQGFQGVIPEEPDTLIKEARDKFGPQVRSVQDIMFESDGKDWWAAHGSSFFGMILLPRGLANRNVVFGASD